MKIIVVHDKLGNIKSVAVPSAEFSGQIRLRPPRGQHVAEVEIGISHLKVEEDFESVRTLRENFRIDTSGEPKLIKRPRTSKR